MFGGVPTLSSVHVFGAQSWLFSMFPWPYCAQAYTDEELGSVAYCALNYVSWRCIVQELHWIQPADCLSYTSNDKPEEQYSVSEFNWKSDILLWLNIAVLCLVFISNYNAVHYASCTIKSQWIGMQFWYGHVCLLPVTDWYWHVCLLPVTDVL